MVLVVVAQLLQQPLVVVLVPCFPILPQQEEPLFQARHGVPHQLVEGPDDKVDKPLLQRNPPLTCAVAHWRKRHRVGPLLVALEEELVRHPHGPLLGDGEGLEDIGCVGALDDDFHGELRVDLPVLQRRRGLGQPLELGRVVAVARHVSRQDVAQDGGPEQRVVLPAELGQQLDLRVEYELEGAAAVVVLEDGAVVVECREVRPRGDEEGVVDPGVLEVMAEGADDEREELDVGERLVHARLDREAVGRLGDVEGVEPVVVGVVKHAGAHAEDELLELHDRYVDLVREAERDEDLEGEVHEVV
mmetsp:Transcript_48086/g.120216  ORF Transcript_48086/g.120216 Transcript_48086/m.120216 type:complete len:303 (-) Transcript_48086:135-1043(-)